MTLKEIMQRHPLPWTDKTSGGTVTIYDANGQQVGLLTVVKFVVLVTALLKRKST